MANTKSALKRVRQTESVNSRKRSQTAALRTAIKKVRQAVETGEGDSQALFNAAVKAIDSAVNKGLIHHNKASRDKSRLAKLVNSAK
ncbi:MULTISPECIES: 30S ribosomal protein S20 [Facklamia]|uniref:Small ribosomal subunit protein bS20 n=2 Tax=Facklamia hominis TaxID=178214 RepID=K1MJS6_9LACT|nr:MULTISPECIES: 30S ribosomal protein S20 [Facklamia]EKB56164.1 ribosomal protein S20 [Facklamia hominis CCUG 36813]EPH12955.1 ribosomal protein S20 [Facklamia hominis ACS-120-V-Sch10]MDK7186697.1 30S ribosomal protein S20 [Facklamia hominis]OFL68181.1 30S ribosomal protein S20 [Facklamia sp. HMSC062C11]PKY92778.1 30S ribosomal protein S20 [Facklamia hominis]